MRLLYQDRSIPVEDGQPVFEALRDALYNPRFPPSDRMMIARILSDYGIIYDGQGREELVAFLIRRKALEVVDVREEHNPEQSEDPENVTRSVAE